MSRNSSAFDRVLAVFEWMLLIFAGLVMTVLIGILLGLAMLIWAEVPKAQLTPAQQACIQEATK